ncbi:YcnI family protein [Hamadaea tsunoensis]|uniref:YcnI family protein n=1 Tax=Hamadaea tsunoensis TaxID=53368 RepID=UPI00041FCFDA|nr:YcnI family protein [Hamadaea tsunoensis]
MTRTVVRRLATVAAGAAAAIALVAGPAAAHVTVNPSTATQGGYAKLTFRVPNETTTADTTKVEVVVPTDHPIPSISLRPVPGWTAAVERSKLATPLKDDDGNEVTDAISKITWTAAADAVIKPGQFQEFDVSAGPLPQVDQIVFKALQTYSDGNVVRWIEEPKAGEEAEHPAPVLKLTPKGSTNTGAATTTAAGATVTASADDKDNGSPWPLVISIVSLVVALAAVGLALRRRPSGSQA